MLKKFKQWVYGFVREAILTDDEFISSFYEMLEYEKNTRLLIVKAKEKQKRDEEVLKRIAVRLADIEKRKNLCTHLKGGYGIKSPSVDYNISVHTFINNQSIVKCLTCGKEWTGEQLKSAEIQHMLNHTTNTITSSEVPYSKPKDCTEPPFIDVDMIDDARVVEEMNNNPLWPWVSRVYVKWWAKMYKKLNRKRKTKNGPDNIS